MTRFEADRVRDLVECTTGTVLSPESAARTARMLSASAATLDELAGTPLFDTEPAQLVSVLNALGTSVSPR